MKKMIPLCFAFMAIFYSASAQTATTDSSYKENRIMAPQNLIDLSDYSNDKFGIIMIYTEEKVVSIFYLPKDKQVIKKRSKEEDELISIIMLAYWENISKQKVKLDRKLYKDKEFKSLVLKKEGV